MTTLEQLVNEQKWNDMTDIQIIKAFFDLNDMEEEGIDLINELSKTKIEKMKRKYQLAEVWASHFPSRYLYENYDFDIASRLHNLEIDYVVNGEGLSNNYLVWARENIPNIVRPQVYFNPLVEWLENNGIRFKDE